MSQQIERRTVRTEVRAKQSGRLEGHAALFEELSVDLGGFREKIAPGAFADTIKGGDIRALFNHDSNLILGRTTNGTLKLEEDRKGLHFSLKPAATQAGHDAIELVRRGDVTGCSFGFVVLDEEWQNGSNGQPDIRTLRKVELHEISPVCSWPAYEATAVAVRSHDRWRLKRSRPRRSPEWRRKALEAMEKDVEPRLRQRTKRPPSKPGHRAPAADGRVVLTGRQLADAVKEHRVEARRTCDHESAHALLFLFQGAGVDSVRMFWRAKWGTYRPAGGSVTARDRYSSTITAAPYCAGLIGEDRRGLGWTPSRASQEDREAVRRLTPRSHDMWNAQETARKVLKTYYRVFDAISYRLLCEGKLSGVECSRIFEAERQRLKRLGRAA